MSQSSDTYQTKIEHRTEEPADLYLYRLDTTVVVNSPVSVGDTTITVVDTTGLVLGEAITFYENNRVYQSLIKAITATTITLSSPIDYAYTSEAIVECGPWNMAVDGGTTAQEFSIKSPKLSNIEVSTINCSILDGAAMDDGKFGGISQLTNGIIFGTENGIDKNLALVVNNLGFWEIGFDVVYSDSAPAGEYGMKARRNVIDVNGVVLDLKGDDGGKFKITIQDDLTGLTQLACAINGHLLYQE